MDPIQDLLSGCFGIQDLRSFQRDTVDALLGGAGRVLLVAPTGGGKSLCYQLPALLLDGTALVLSPLISLMEDQVHALAARGIAATYLASTLPREENARRLAELRRGAYRIVYAAPERLAQPGFLEALSSIRLSLVAVDEAHCIVQWGHDFRPDYLRIGEALDRLSPPRVIACTATATPEARAEIARALGWEGAPYTLVLRGFARPNLHLAVRPVSGPREAQQETARALVEALGSTSHPEGAAIVYTATRRGAEHLAERLVERGFHAAAYHAGLDAAVRAQVSAAFANRTLPVVVATNAFGMGIDRPDVRIVVHAQPSASIEAYYQEVGRAGRDGAEARGLLLISGIDLALRRRLSAMGEGGAAASPEDAARAWDRFRELLSYVDAATCRHDFILRHFGDEAESLGGCGHCDVCLAARDPAALDEDRDAVRRALAGVARARGTVGLAAVAAMLAGERNARVTKAGLDRLSTFGVLAGRTGEEVMGILRALLANGWIDLDGGDYPVPRMTPLGWKVVRGELEIRVRLPSFPSRAQARSARRLPKKPLGRQEPRGGVEAAMPGAQSPNPAPAPALFPSEAPAPDPQILAALRAHRSVLARARSVPPYVIAPDRTLAAIATARPQNDADLLRCHGMGPSRLASYGEGFLAIVRGPVAVLPAPDTPLALSSAPPIAGTDSLAATTTQHGDRAPDLAGGNIGPPRVRSTALDDLAFARFWQLVQRQ
ncbi:MAG: ATP-dependent DNA helicase RecQ [Minicystis sp.]